MKSLLQNGHFHFSKKTCKEKEQKATEETRETADEIPGEKFVGEFQAGQYLLVKHGKAKYYVLQVLDLLDDKNEPLCRWFAPPKRPTGFWQTITQLYRLDESCQVICQLDEPQHKEKRKQTWPSVMKFLFPSDV